MNGIFWKGFKRPLQNADIYKTMPQDETKGLTDRLEGYVNKLLIYLYDNVLIYKISNFLLMHLFFLFIG